MAHGPIYREAHPLPMLLTHWLHLISMVILAFTGFYIHYPFFPGFMSVARGSHFFFMYVLIITLVVRIILMFTVKTAGVADSREKSLDAKNFLPQKENRGSLFPTIGYYLFVKKDYSHNAKYNSLQKVSYILIPIMIVFMAWTGFSIYGPYMDNSFFQSSVELVGGPMNMRIIHYFMLWAFIIFTVIHAYLATIYGFAPAKMIFAWKESPKD
jgi:Ni/Fe-hydrogenase 1 B-type cytochrome subunit